MDTHVHTKPKIAVDPLASEPACYSIDAFCAAHGIARSFLYKLWARNLGPRWLYLGKRRRLISREEAAAWQARMTEASGNGQSS